MKPQVGQLMETWWGTVAILKVEPYRGKYPQWFKWVVTLPIRNGGKLEMAVDIDLS